MSRETFVLHSSLPLDRFEAVLRQTVSTDRWWREFPLAFLFNAGTSPVVVKFLRAGIRLRRLHYLINNSHYPVFYASYQAEPSGTRIEGHFDLLPHTKLGTGILRVLAIVVCSLFVLRTLSGLFTGQHYTIKNDPTDLFAVIVFVCLGFLLPQFLSFLGRGDKPFILDYLQNHFLARIEEQLAKS